MYMLTKKMWLKLGKSCLRFQLFKSSLYNPGLDVVSLPPTDAALKHHSLWWFHLTKFSTWYWIDFDDDVDKIWYAYKEPGVVWRSEANYQPNTSCRLKDLLEEQESVQEDIKHLKIRKKTAPNSDELSNFLQQVKTLPRLCHIWTNGQKLLLFNHRMKV